MSELIRQTGEQIKAVLSQLGSMPVGEESFLNLDDAITACATILYPQGVQTEEAYNRLLAITKAGCVNIGYGSEEVMLRPPRVPFHKRGIYLKKMPDLNDSRLKEIFEELSDEDAIPLSKPVLALERSYVIQVVAQECWQTDHLTANQERFIGQRCDEVVQAAGWKCEVVSDCYLEGRAYICPMIPNLERLREWLAYQVRRGQTNIGYLKQAGLQQAFNTSLVMYDPDALISEETWARFFDELGYVYDTNHPRLKAKPLELPKDAELRLRLALEQLQPRTFEHSGYGKKRARVVLVKDEVIEVTQKVLGIEPLTDRRLRLLLTDGVLARALTYLGYETRQLWVHRDELTPPIERENAYIYQRTLHIEQGLQPVSFAKGFTVHSPVLVSHDETLIYLELLGPRQAVRANWAALRGGRSHRFAGNKITVKKEDRVITMKATLSVGWDHWALLHRQASVDVMTPGEPFYLLDDGKLPIPKAFYPMLSKSLAVPILPDWAQYLWVEGRLGSLIQPLNKGGLGMAGWKILSDEKKWEQIISQGLSDKQIAFS